MFRILRCITDAVGEIDGPEVYLVPTSIVATTSARGGSHDHRAYGAVKRDPKTCAFWSVGDSRASDGAPISASHALRESATQEMRADKSGTGSEDQAGSRWMSSRINRATQLPHRGGESGPGRPDRSLSISGVLATVSPVGQLHSCPQLSGGRRRRSDESLGDPVDLADSLASGVVSVYDAGTEAIVGHRQPAPEWRRFYRNTAIISWSIRAVAELALLAAAGLQQTARFPGDRA